MKFSVKDQGHIAIATYYTHEEKNMHHIVESKTTTNNKKKPFCMCLCTSGWVCICEHISFVCVSLFYIEMACNASVVNLHISFPKKENKYHSIRIEAILEYRYISKESRECQKAEEKRNVKKSLLDCCMNCVWATETNVCGKCVKQWTYSNFHEIKEIKINMKI